MKKDEVKSMRQIKLGTMASYVGIVLNIVMGLLYTPWMIRQIGQSDYALYTLATSLITMFTIDFGMSAAVSRFVAKYNAEGNTEAINNFLGLVYKLYSLVSAVALTILVVLFFLLDTLYANLSAVELHRFKIVYLIAGMYSVVSFPFVTFNGILNAYEQFVGLKLCELFNKLATVVLIAGALMMNGNVYALVAVNAIVGLVTIAVKFLIIKKNTDIHVNFRFFSKEKLKEIFGYSAWSTVGSIAQNYLINITPSILAMVTNSVEVAIFGFANSMGSYIYTLAMGIDGFFLPKVSRMLTNHEDSGAFLNLMVRVGRFQLYILGLILIGFVLAGKDFILLLMGAEYEIAYYCVICYLTYSVICYPQQIANTMVIATNRVKERALISVAAAIANVALSFVLSHFYGAVGACISICVAILIRTLLLNILYKRKIGLDVVQYFKRCHLTLVPAFGLAAVLSYAATSCIKGLDWRIFLLKAGIISVIYCGCVCVLGLNKEEKNMVRRMLRR